MAQFNENFIIASPNPADRRYLSLRTLGGSQLPYSSVTEVYNVVIPAVRYSGQTVLIRTGGTNVEYWFKNGVANSNLIEKKYDSTLPLADYVTGGTNLGFFSGYTGVQTLPIDHLLDSNYDGNYRSLYNYYYRGTDGKIHIGVPNDGIEKRGYVKTTPLPVTSWIWNEYIGDASVGWMPIMGNIANQVGTFQPSVLYYPPSIPYTATSWNTGSAYNNGSNLVVNTVLGSLTTGTTLTIGGPPFAFMEHNNLHFRTIMTQTPNTLAVSYTEPFINLSGATFGASGNNLGIGAEVYKNTTIAGSNSILNFRTLVGSGGTHVHEVGDYIYIESSGGSGSGISYNFIGSGATKVTTIGNNVYIYSPSGNSESISKIITQPSHPFNPGEVVGFSGGTYNQPIADGTYNGEIIGLTSKYIDANTFEVTQAGFVSGLTGLVASTTYFLSAIVAGQLTATEPTGNTQISKAVIIATSTTSGWVLPYPGYYITSGVTLSWNNLQNKPQWLSATTLNAFQTGHTHSYINLTNKPTFVGSGNTTVTPSGNSFIIYSSSGTSLTGYWTSAQTVNYVTGYTSGFTTGNTFNNGLIQSGQVVGLGGTLTGATDISGAQSLSFGYITPLTSMLICSNNISTSGDYVMMNTTTGPFVQIWSPAYGDYISLGNQYGASIDIYTGCTNIYNTDVYAYGSNCLKLCSNTDVILTNNNTSTVRLTGSTIGLTGAIKAFTTPATGAVSDSVLVWNSSDKCVKSISVATITGNTIVTANNGLTKSGNNVRLGGTLTGNTSIVLNAKQLLFTGATGYQAKFNPLADNILFQTSGATPSYLELDTNLVRMGGTRTCIYAGGAGNWIDIDGAADSLNHYVAGGPLIIASQLITDIKVCSCTILCSNASIGRTVLQQPPNCGSACLTMGNALNDDIELSTGGMCVYLDDANSSVRISNATALINLTGNTINNTGAVRLLTTPSNGTISDSMLLWNSTDKAIKKLPYPGGGGDKNNIYSMTTVGTGTTLLTTGDSYVILVDHISGVSTIILPSGVTITQGLAFKIKDASYNANTYNITINSASPTRYIDDGVSTTAVINTNGGAYELAYDQTLDKWFTLAVVN